MIERRRRLPVRPCALCGEQKPVLQLTQVRGRWLCAPCFRTHVLRARKPGEGAGEGRAEDVPGAAAQGGAGAAAAAQAPAPARGGRRSPDPTLLWTLRVVDGVFRYGGLLARIAVYGVLFALAESTGFGPQLMAGFLLADGVTWLLGAVLDLRFHRLAVAAETLFFGVMFWLWLQTGWSFPDHPADRAILGLGALAAFTGRAGALATRLTR